MADSLAKILPFSIMSQIWAQFANTRLISRQQMAPTISNSVKLGYFHTGCRVVDNRQVNVLVQDFSKTVLRINYPYMITGERGVEI